MLTAAEIGNIVRETRDSKGFTQSHLATDTNVTTRTIQNIEKGNCYPTYEVLHKILHSLDFSADHLFWPDRMSYTPKQEQLMKALADCSEDEQEIVLEVAFACLRSMKLNNDSKKADKN